MGRRDSINVPVPGLITSLPSTPLTLGTVPQTGRHHIVASSASLLPIDSHQA
jgi:hypothetical protein